MQLIVKWWKKESATIVGIVLAIAGAGLVPGTAAKLILTVLPLLGAGAVRNTVSNPFTVNSKVAEAATAAITAAAPADVGGPGVITPAGSEIVTKVVNEVAPV